MKPLAILLAAATFFSVSMSAAAQGAAGVPGAASAEAPAGASADIKAGASPSVAASASASAGVKGKPVVAVSILPLQYFAQRVGGDRIQILVLVGPGQSPHSYEPTPRQMASLAQAIVWFTTGIEFENSLVPKIHGLYAKLKIVDTAEGVPTRTLEAHGHEGETGHGDESGRDPHIWLGQAGALRQAAIMRDTLAGIDPAGAATYRKNYEAFARDVGMTFASLSKDLASLKGKPVFVYHPAFGYFLDEFGISQEAVETGGKEPTQKALAALIAAAKADGAKVIFVQPQFSRTAANSIARAIGGTVAEFDDLAADWLDNLKRMGAALRKAVP